MRKERDIDWEKELGDSNPIEMLNKVMGKLNKTIDKNIPKSEPRNTFEERNCSKHQEKTSTMGKVHGGQKQRET